jgi:hypothetical protein
MVTRADIQGALKVLNATGTKNRRAALTAMLTKEHSPAQVTKALADLESYPEWSARLDLEEGAPAPIPAKKKAKGK